MREHLRALTAAGARAVPLRRPAELAEVDGVVLPGGESTTMIRLLRRFELLAPLQRAVSEGLPAFGSCAGLILLASQVVDGEADQAGIGGLDVAVRRNAFGRQIASFEADLDLAGAAGPALRAVFIRAPWVEQVGAGVEVLARWDGKIVAVREQSVLGTAFHPELTSDHRVHRMFVAMAREAAA